MQRDQTKYDYTESGLIAPESYLSSSKEEKLAVINGCGPDGSINEIIPDYILGMKAVEACHIHDWEFEKAKSQDEYKKADKNFKKNLLTLVENKTENNLLKAARRAVAHIYYWAARGYSKIFGR